MLKTIMAFAEKRKVDYSEKLLWCALKYALCMDEGDATEAVIVTMAPKIPSFSDQMLHDSLTAVESYIRSGTCGEEERVFIPEWSDVRAWLLKEKEARTGKRVADES